MRIIAALVCALVAVPFGTSAQEVPYRLIDAPVGEPLVRPMVFTIPEHDPLLEQIAFAAHAMFFEEADVPFFLNRVGRIVPRSDPRTAVADWLAEEYIVLVCDVPMGDGESLDLNSSESREEHCLNLR